jgi:YD repeat-containing protein
LTYTYNGGGQLDSIQSNHANGVDLSYSYDNADSLAGYVYPNGVETAYTYNTLNRLTQMTVNKGATSLASYA